MLEHKTNFRVRYAETDRMGYLYYGNYAAYFEVGRVELLRSRGVSYKSLEDRGILLPVRDLSIKFLKPAYYDEVLTLTTRLISSGRVSIRFLYELHNESQSLLTTADTTLVFVDKLTGRPMAGPQDVLAVLT